MSTRRTLICAIAGALLAAGRAAVHRVFGIEDFALQSLYHFTVGGAVNDPRLTTLAPYGASVDALDN